jgi:polyisoprenoid-binding protein YceI
MMIKSFAAACLAALPLCAVAAPESYTFDPTDTYPNFIVDHFAITPIYGRFNKSAGKFTIDRAAKTGTLEVTIDVASVDTGDTERNGRPRTRDEHLRSADFFNAAEFPTMTYKATHIGFDGDNPRTIEGNLTLLGVTKPVPLTLERFKCNPATATAKERCGGAAVGKLNRSDFGMNRSVGSNSNEITLIVAFGANKD